MKYKIKIPLCSMLILIFMSIVIVASDNTKVLTYSWAVNVGPLNPHLYSPNQMFAQAMLYEPLVNYQQDGSLQPWLAEKWDISSDGKVYTFFLRKDVVFSDNVPFSAQAVKKNFDAILKNVNRHGWLELINQIAHIEVIDSFTIKFSLKNAYYPFLQELSVCRPIRFLSPAAFPDDGNTAQGIKKPIGTGRWILSESKKGEYDVFIRNEKYWGVKPTLEKIIVKVIPDPDMRTIAFETGEIDLIFGAGGHSGGQISLEAFNQFQQQPDKYTSMLSSMPVTRMLALNTDRGVTKELAVRKAILYSVNKDALLRSIFLGCEKEADFLFDPNLPYCNVNLQPYQYDTKTSKTILDDAGWKTVSGKAFRVKNGIVLETELCFVGNDAMQKSIAEFTQAELKKIGLKLNLIGEEPDAFYNRQKSGEFGLIFNDTWGTPYDPHSFVSSMRAPSHADYQAQSGLSMKKQIDQNITSVLTSIDKAQRQELYRYIFKTLHEQAVYLPISQSSTIAVFPKNITGVTFKPTSYDIPFESINKH